MTGSPRRGARGGRGRPRLPGLLARAALVLAGVGVALLLVEIALRLGVVETEPYRLGREIREAEGKTRVLILGDSFSVDWHNQDRPDLDLTKSATLLLREWLEAEGVHVLNLAERASGPPDYQRRFERYGARYRPDLVLLNYYVGNDLLDSRSSQQPSLKGRLAERLRRFTLLAHAFRDVRRGLLARGNKAEADTAGLLNTVLIDLGKSQPHQYVESLTLNTPGAEASWERNQETLLAIVRGAERGTRFLINIFPAAVQVNSTHYEFLGGLGFRLDPAFLTSRVPQDRMLDFCREHELDCFDLLEGFRARSEIQTYLDRDTHWNTAGDRLAFELLKARTEPILAELSTH